MTIQGFVWDVIGSLLIIAGLMGVFFAPLRATLREGSHLNTAGALSPRGSIVERIAVILGMAGAILQLAPKIPGIVAWISASAAGRHALFVTIAISLGLALFALRKSNRLAYGALEVVIAVAGLAAYPVAPPSTEQLTAATAAWVLGALSLVYIFIRGLDNIDTHYKARPGTDSALRG